MNRESTQIAQPYSEAAARNQAPILEQLRMLLSPDRSYCVLEIGSGTAQHAIHFVQALPQLVWFASDLINNHAGIQCALARVELPRLIGPLDVDARSLAQLDLQPDVIYTANTCHIMSWSNVQHLVANVAQKLRPQGRFIVYGPFNVGGLPTADSNYRFDQYLSQNNPDSGLRGREEMAWLADHHGLSLTDCISMPANNMLLVFERRADGC